MSASSIGRSSIQRRLVIDVPAPQCRGIGREKRFKLDGFHMPVAEADVVPPFVPLLNYSPLLDEFICVTRRYPVEILFGDRDCVELRLLPKPPLVVGKAHVQKQTGVSQGTHVARHSDHGFCDDIREWTSAKMEASPRRGVVAVTSQRKIARVLPKSSRSLVGRTLVERVGPFIRGVRLNCVEPIVDSEI